MISHGNRMFSKIWVRACCCLPFLDVFWPEFCNGVSPADPLYSDYICRDIGPCGSVRGMDSGLPSHAIHLVVALGYE